VIYTATTRALAALELLAHFEREDAPAELLLLAIEVPDAPEPRRISAEVLPAGWYAEVGPDSCRRIGEEWLANGDSVTLQVPSAIVPEEFNLLLNPIHPAFPGVAVVGERSFSFDPRLVK
jgi:RES domain-containing protein